MSAFGVRAGVKRVFTLAVWRRGRARQEVDDEIRLHLDLRAEQLVRRGLSAAEARVEAERRFGAVDEARERLLRSAQRREDRIRMSEQWDALKQDVGYALRGVRRAPAFAAVVVATLALGIGSTTALFSVVNGVLLRPLPYRAPDELMAIYTRFQVLGLERANVSEPEYRDVQTLSAFRSAAAMSSGDVTITGSGEPEQVKGVYATASFFPTLGTPTLVGRPFSAAEDRPGRDQVVVLAHGYWQRRFGGDPAAVGRTMITDGAARTIVGVMPPQFTFWEGDLFLPLAFDPDSVAGRGAHNYSAIGRLAPGASPQQAEAQLRALTARLRRDYPTSYRADAAFELFGVPLHESMVGAVRPALRVLSGAVGLVLLIACANAANLLLVRGEGRQRELAVRAALGAGRRRVVRQLLTESALLALVAGALGLLAAAWGVRALLAVNPDALPRAQSVTIDGVVAAVAVALSLLAGLLFGTAPALQVTRHDLQGVLRGGGRGGSGAHRSALRRFLVVSEVALAIVVVIAGGLLLRSFLALRAVDSGVDASSVLTFSTSLPESRYPRPRVEPTYARLLDEVRALPGVTAAGGVWLLPFAGRESNWDVKVEGREQPPGAADPSPRPQILTPGALEAMRMPVLRGRTLTASDDARAPLVGLVNETMARTLWPGADALGKRFRLSGDSTPWITVVGVVRDARSSGLQRPPLAEFYVPHAQFSALSGGFVLRSMSIVVRAARDPVSLADPVRRVLRAADPDLAVADVRTMRQVVDRSVAQPRFTMLLLVVFGGVALLLATVGVYGVISYSVAQRTRELGIRIALGARRAHLVRLVLGQGLGLAGVGVAVGVVAALAATRLLSSLLFGVSPTDPATFAAIALLLLAVAAAASLVPARRAARADPMAALRAE